MKPHVMNLLQAISIVGGLLAIVTQSAFSQACCTTGSMSLGGTERSISNEGILNISLSYQSSHLGATHEGTQRVVDLLDRTADVQLVKLEIEYGLASRMSLFVNLNYVSRSRELAARDPVTRAPERIPFEGSGVGDPVVLVKYEAVSLTFLQPFGLTLGGGAKLPIGNYRLGREGTRLPIDLQPSNGAVELLSWIFAQYKFTGHSLGFQVHALYRYSSINLDGYRFGDEITTSVGSYYPFINFFAGAITLRGRFAQPDYSNRRILDGTGGSSWYAEPQLLYFEGNSTFRIFVQLPVYQNVRGNQLTTSSVIGLELLQTLDVGRWLRSSGSTEEKEE